MRENSRRAHRVRWNDADWHDLVRLGDHAVGGESHERVEVHGGQAVGQIAIVIGLAGANQGEISAKRKFQEEGAPLDLDYSFALFHHRANAGWREDAAKAVAAGADA